MGVLGWPNVFTMHRKHSQLECRKTVVHSTFIVRCIACVGHSIYCGMVY